MAGTTAGKQSDLGSKDDLVTGSINKQYDNSIWQLPSSEEL